jgi:hypothetical protein
MSDIEKLNKKYNFLHSHIAKEPHVFEVLDEIQSYQDHVLKVGKGKLATLESLKASRNIKLPFTHVREKNVAYIVETLANTYKDEIKRIVSFNFIAEANTKKLTIDEEVEYTVECSNADLNRIQEVRDRESLENLSALLIKFRLFNLTKLVKKSKYKNHLSRLIKSELGKTIFTFKNYSIDRNNLEAAEDFCFHKNNYDAVKSTVQVENVKKIITNYSSQIMRRLQKFGILNSEFSDYRDSKVDYLMNILLDDLSTTLVAKDLVEVKNFNSIRTCLQKVDKLMDPLITIGEDILKYVRENKIAKQSDITAIYNVTDEKFDAWISENATKYKLITFVDDAADHFIIDGPTFYNQIVELNKKILHNQEEFSKLSHVERQESIDLFEIFYNVGKNLLATEDKLRQVISKDEQIEKLKEILKEYSDYKKRMSYHEETVKEKSTDKKKKSILGMITGFFKSLFGRKKKEPGTARKSQAGSTSRQPTLSKDQKSIIRKVEESASKVIALSNYIELSEDNNFEIDSIIETLRSKNKKTVIPIYNARKTLYPKRSKKYLISDVEYLLVDPDILQTPDTIRAFTDSLANYKLKEEIIPGSTIMVIEKYLLTLYRQKRAQMKRKEAVKKNNKE